MPSLLKTRCPHCQVVAKVSDDHLGKRVRCPTCKQPFEVLSVEVGHLSPATIEAAWVAEETIGDGGVGDRSAEVVGRATATPPSPNTIETARPLGSLGRFELKELLGQGAFGRVYKAYDPQLDRFVALKVPTFGRGDKHKINRFIAEAKAAARLRHPNIVPTYESGQIEGRYYIAAQFVSGQVLSERVSASGPDFRQTADWVRQLAEALAYAHGEGIVHRDIKPENIMLDEKGVPQIMDFGLAKRVNEDSNMTTDGTILGTPAYMAPEQARGDHSKVGPHSDQYSLGVVLYELLSGQRPFTGPPHAVIAQVIAVEPPAPQSINPRIPRDLSAICQKAISKEPSRRYASTTDLADDLHRLLRGETTLARPISLAERSSRWCRRNPLVAGLIAAVILITTAGLVGTSLALWQANRNAVHADEQRQLAESNLQEADEQRLLAEQNSAEARDQREAAEANLKLANDRAAEAKAAKEDAEAQTKRLTETLATLQTETDARKMAEQARLALEKTKTTLESTAATLTKERETALRESIDLFYRDRLSKANEATTARNFDAAIALLGECPVECRGWEWRYLMATARQIDGVLRTANAPAFPRSVRHSSDGKFLLAGSSYRHDNLFQEYSKATEAASRTAWNAVYSLDSGRSIELPIGIGSRHGGRVCAFSRDGTRLLTVNNTASTYRAHPQFWVWNNGWRIEREPGYFKGHALDCGETASGEWVVLALGADSNSGKTRYSLPLTLHNLTRATSQELVPAEGAGIFHAACFDPPISKIHVLYYYSGLQKKSASGTIYQVIDMASGQSRQLLSLAAPYPGIRAGRDPDLPFFPTDPEHGIVLEYPATGRNAREYSTTGGKARSASSALIVFGGKVLNQPSIPVGNHAATFDPDGQRIIALIPDKGLDIFDPASPLADRKLLHIPLAAKATKNGRYSAAMAFDSRGDQLAVAINDSLAFFNVSGGVSGSPRP